LVLALGAPGPCFAEPELEPRARATELFEEAKVYLKQNRFEEACPRFAESYTLDPKLGAQMNMARCYEIIGRTATAWSTWRAVADTAGLRKLLTNNESERKFEAEREAFARSRIEWLSDHLAYVTVRVAGDVAALEVRLDGQVLPPARWGARMPLDPGVHAVVAESPGRVPWSTEFQVGGEERRVDVSVPALAPVVPPRDVAAPPPAVANRTAMTEWRWAAVAAAGLAGVATGIGAGFGWAAIDAHSRAIDDCKPSSNCLSARARDMGELHRDADASDIALSAAVVAASAAAVLWFAAPAPRRWSLGGAFGDHATWAITLRSSW
jgi:hypothetical protein